MQRLRVHFSGRVQGVGFRATACGVAERYPVTGYVKNLPDGRVEMVAEGDAGDLQRFVSAVESAMAGCISETKTEEVPGERRFSRFSVAR